jgi:hypothetical protein
MKKLIKDLQTLNKQLNALAKKTESLLKQVDKFEKPKAVKKAKAKPGKVKAVKKAPAKKVVVRRTAPPTAADKVFAIIKRCKKGINTEALMNKTGYERKAISNCIYKLTKQGKIKTVAKGVYVKA